MRCVENPSKLTFVDDGFLMVFDASWNRIDKVHPIELLQGQEISLEDIYDKYKEHGIIIVVHESYLAGQIYRYGNYSDGKWWNIGQLYGFA